MREVFLPSPSEWAARPTLWQDYLLDISGRQVMVLRPGANDVRALAPGVYFVREQDSRGLGVEDSMVRKVIVTR